MPDFDIDFCQDRRDEVIRYVQQKYGRDRVAQIITFGKLQARAVLRDVGRVLGMPYGQVDRLCKLVPNNPAHPVTPRPGDRRRAAAAAAARQRRERRAADDDRAEARRPLPPRLDPCRRRGDRRPAAGRAGAALPRPALRHAGDPVQHEMGRAGGARQIRLSRPQDPDRAGALPRAAGRRAASSSTSPTCRSTTAPTFDLLARGDTVGVFQVEGAGRARHAAASCGPTASRTSSRSSRSTGRGRWRTSRATSRSSTARRSPTTCTRSSRGS